MTLQNTLDPKHELRFDAFVAIVRHRLVAVRYVDAKVLRAA